MVPSRSTFRQRLAQLAATVGDGDLVGTYTVGQRYAAVQHVRRDYRHPRGGGPDYVSIPLRARHRVWFRGIAAGLLSGRAPARMAASLEDLDAQVRRLAPVDLGNLRRSGAVVVTTTGTPVYRRPAEVPRLPR